MKLTSPNARSSLYWRSVLLWKAKNSRLGEFCFVGTIVPSTQRERETLVDA